MAALIGNVFYDDRNGGQLSQLRGSPTPLARQDLKTARRQGPRDDRLQYPLRLYAVRETLQRILVKVTARLIRASLQLLNGQFAQRICVDSKRAALCLTWGRCVVGLFSKPVPSSASRPRLSFRFGAISSGPCYFVLVCA